MRSEDLRFNSTPKRPPKLVSRKYNYFLKHLKSKNKDLSGKEELFQLNDRNDSLTTTSNISNHYIDQNKIMNPHRKLIFDQVEYLQNKEHVAKNYNTGKPANLAFGSPRRKISGIETKNIKYDKINGNGMQKPILRELIDKSNGRSQLSPENRRYLVNNAPFVEPGPYCFLNTQNYYNQHFGEPLTQNSNQLLLDYDYYEVQKMLREQAEFSQFQARVIREREILYKKKAALRQIALDAMRLVQQRELRYNENNIVAKMSGLNLRSQEFVPNTNASSLNCKPIECLTAKEQEKVQRDKAMKMARIMKYLEEVKQDKEHAEKVRLQNLLALEKNFINRTGNHKTQNQQQSIEEPPSINYTNTHPFFEKQSIYHSTYKTASENAVLRYGTDELKRMNQYGFYY